MSNLENLDLSEYGKKLSLLGIAYFSDKVGLLCLKIEFLRLSRHHESMLKRKATHFCRIFNFFSFAGKGMHDYEELLLNLFILVQLSMIHLAATSTFELSFSLTKFIESSRSAMVDYEHFN